MTDHNAWLGRWPFRDLGKRGDAEFLLRAMDRLEIERAWVSPLDAILHRDPHAANRRLFAETLPHADRLLPVPLLSVRAGSNAICSLGLAEGRVPAVRMLPFLERAEPEDATPVARELAARGIAVLLTCRLIDARARHPCMPLPEMPPGRLPTWIAALAPARVIVAGCRTEELESVAEALVARDGAAESSFLDAPDSLAVVRGMIGPGRLLPGSNAPMNFQESLFAKWRGCNAAPLQESA